MSGEVLQKALQTSLNLKGKGSFLHYANIDFNNSFWRVAGEKLDLKKKYKVVIPSFLVEKGDIGLEFLKFSENSTIKSLNAVKADVRQALIEAFLSMEQKE